MTNSMWGKLEKLPVERKPEDILQEQCELINAEFSDTLHVVTQRMEKPLEEYSVAPIANMATIVSGLTEPRKIESLLGEFSNDRSITYELVVTSPIIPSYKYRILFVQHGLSAYPSYVYIENAIKRELNEDNSPFVLRSENEFSLLAGKVLGSQRVRTVLNRIISYNSLK